MPQSPEPAHSGPVQPSTAQPAFEANPASADFASLRSLGPRRIVLTGFMAAGKTTVGRLLAHQVGWPFRDADVEIETVTGLTVPDIFRIHGEPWFRELEHHTIRDLLRQEPLVLAMGGGAIEDPRTRALLLGSDSEGQPASDSSIYLVNLEATLETTLARCGSADTAASMRPVLADLDNLEKRYRARLPFYRQAHQTIQVDGLSPEAIAETIRIHICLQSAP